MKHTKPVIDYRLPTNAVKRHAISEDATLTGHPRLTCVCKATLVRQPWMSDAAWQHAAKSFRKDHR